MGRLDSGAPAAAAQGLSASFWRFRNQFLRLNHTTSRPNAAPEELELRDSEPEQRDNDGIEESADGPVRRLSRDLSGGTVVERQTSSGPRKLSRLTPIRSRPQGSCNHTDPCNLIERLQATGHLRRVSGRRRIGLPPSPGVEGGVSPDSKVGRQPAQGFGFAPATGGPWMVRM